MVPIQIVEPVLYKTIRDPPSIRQVQYLKPAILFDAAANCCRNVRGTCNHVTSRSRQLDHGRMPISLWHGELHSHVLRDWTHPRSRHFQYSVACIRRSSHTSCMNYGKAHITGIFM